MLEVTMAGCANLVSVSSVSGPSKHRFLSEKPSAASARSQISRAAAELSKSCLPMPTCCVPCPGKSHAVVNERAPLHADQRAAPGNTRTQRAHQDGVAGLDAPIAQALVERDGDRRAGRIAVAL